MEYISIVNWHEYQHYKERNPPWIKLHNKILDCYEYGCLQDASKLLLMSLYLLASRTDNKIPNDVEWIKSKAMLKGKIDINPLIKFGFISVSKECLQDASKTLAGCMQNADSETETETETETEKRQILSACGSFQNVKLTEDEYTKLKGQFGKEDADRRIETLSEYLASKGKKYKSHYATILSWARKEGWKSESTETKRKNVFLEAGNGDKNHD